MAGAVGLTTSAACTIVSTTVGVTMTVASTTMDLTTTVASKTADLTFTVADTAATKLTETDTMSGEIGLSVMALALGAAGVAIQQYYHNKENCVYNMAFSFLWTTCETFSLSETFKFVFPHRFKSKVWFGLFFGLFWFLNTATCVPLNLVNGGYLGYKFDNDKMDSINGKGHDDGVKGYGDEWSRRGRVV